MYPFLYFQFEYKKVYFFEGNTAVETLWIHYFIIDFMDKAVARV